MNKPRPYIIGETNWQQINSVKYEVAVLPWGATEAHNYHLPYETDNIQLNCIAAESARIAWEEGVKIGVLPCVPFGVNTGQLDIPFCINMNPTTQTAVLADVIESLSGQGIFKLIVLNGHGGNNFRQQLRELQARYSDMFLCTVDWFGVIDPNEIFDDPGDHADEVETSLMMQIAPDLVDDLERAGDGSTNQSRIKAIREGWAWAQRDWLKATNDTGSGDPAKATANKGKELIDALSKKLASFYIELAQSDLSDMYETGSD
ncbi:MAG: creatininase family protein [Verrucomicrobiota bacterium]|nr:creatininase family protein [Verrucomicrobiota bacterium]